MNAKKRTISMMVASVLMTTTLAAVPSAASAQGGTVSTSEIATALSATSANSHDLVAEPAQSSTDVDSAAVATSNSVKVDVPKNLSNGVDVLSHGRAMSISLPNANDAGKATRLPDGTVAYAGKNGSANAVVPTSGGVQMITTIKNASAPSRYTYKVSVPDGGKVTIIKDGRAIVTDARGTVIMAVDAPWAKDANGVSVPTHYETNGVALTQVVDHAGGNYAYPITADPRWISRTWYGAMVVHYTRAETYDLAHGATLGSVLGFRWTPVGVAFGLAAWWVQGVYDRGQCLVAHVWPGSPWATWFWSERC